MDDADKCGDGADEYRSDGRADERRSEVRGPAPYSYETLRDAATDKRSEWDKLGFSGKLLVVSVLLMLVGFFIGAMPVMIFGLALWPLGLLLSFFDRRK